MAPLVFGILVLAQVDLTVTGSIFTLWVDSVPITLEEPPSFDIAYADGTLAQKRSSSRVVLTSSTVVLNVGLTRQGDILTLHSARGHMFHNGEYLDFIFDTETKRIKIRQKRRYQSKKRRLEWKHYKCHQKGQYTLRIAVVMDTGFYKTIGATLDEAENYAKEEIAKASNVWNQNFGIKLAIFKLYVPGGNASHFILDETPDYSVPVDKKGASYKCQKYSRYVDYEDGQYEGIDKFGAQFGFKQYGLWMYLTDCGFRSRKNGKIVRSGNMGVASDRTVCSLHCVFVVRYDEDNVWRYITHEVGHTLGAKHISKDKSGIMSYTKFMWEGELQFNAVHEDRVCDTLLDALSIRDTTLQNDRDTFPFDKCWVKGDADPNIDIDGGDGVPASVPGNGGDDGSGDEEDLEPEDNGTSNANIWVILGIIAFVLVVAGCTLLYCWGKSVPNGGPPAQPTQPSDKQHRPTAPKPTKARRQQKPKKKSGVAR